MEVAVLAELLVAPADTVAPGILAVQELEAGPYEL